MFNYPDGSLHAGWIVGDNIYDIDLSDNSVKEHNLGSSLDGSFVIGELTDENIPYIALAVLGSQGVHCYNMLDMSEPSWSPLMFGGNHLGVGVLAIDLNNDGVDNLVVKHSYDEVAIFGKEPPTHVETEPESFRLGAPFPNPFNSATTLEFELAEKEQVTIDVYNPLGQKVRTLTDDMYSPGKHHVTWDGKDSDGNAVSSGLYILNMKSTTVSSARTVSYIK